MWLLRQREPWVLSLAYDMLYNYPKEDEMSKGIVGIENLKTVCFVGVYPHEKLAKQELLLDLRLEADFSESAVTDSLQDAIDYDKIAELCQQTAEKKHYHLIETLADAILTEIMKKFSITQAWIKIKKLQGLPDAQYAFVELTKQRKP
ncbi:putative dihydroneopterin aldolase [Chlamydiales bacterium STE3]|nr:putative dihydroneopterin aldolase [Chlamydiales bacterium STE3]